MVTNRDKIILDCSRSTKISSRSSELGYNNL